MNLVMENEKISLILPYTSMKIRMEECFSPVVCALLQESRIGGFCISSEYQECTINIRRQEGSEGTEGRCGMVKHLNTG